MKIKQVFNNNAISALDQQQNELVIMGKGLGFMKKPGDAVEEQHIEKVFTIDNQETSNWLTNLLNELPEQMIDISDEIIKNAKLTLGKNLNDIIYVSLTDHIYYALQRHEKGMDIQNALLWEISRLYPEEYKMGQEALNIIEHYTSVRLPEDEAGFIAHHIVNAELNEEMTNVVNITRLTQQVLDIVKYQYHIDINANTLSHHRFVTHLKFFAQRLFSGVQHGSKDEFLFNVVKEKHEDAFRCVKKISKFIEETYGYTLSKDDQLYLTIHIHRVTSNEQVTKNS
ncbi:beta-glucoside operon transcriptional antiterminator [Salibacterium salarium]|uniref:BglG family transcription antiterminator LicT n=1 Tax=Salibacterium salarium TaxID=284579 RepID=UPI0027860CB0|nr:PRD domain-containing protein [Salibacterium salarium]MDQ0297915.1 beta-glucoside operon transcriptional antiterminator [Salibacterium salarium]